MILIHVLVVSHQEKRENLKNVGSVPASSSSSSGYLRKCQAISQSTRRARRSRELVAGEARIMKSFFFDENLLL